jgi:pyruvate ferredoxin oxidoreductase alpha subunit
MAQAPAIAAERKWSRVESVPKGMTGDHTAAEAMRQINPDVLAAYPITPQTEIVERFAEFVAEGEVTTEFVAVESEHSALSACCGSAAAGARAMTCTASQGLALMHEILWIASGHRLPIVMVTVNRALSAPINIHADHSDAMASRDCGWVQLYCHDAQEVYDTTIQAIRLAEHSDVFLPVMVTLDGFVTSHDMERVETLPDETVRAFVGQYNAPYNLLDAKNPVTAGIMAPPTVYFEHRIAQEKALKRAERVLDEVAREYAEITGRYVGAVETYGLDDAEFVIVGLSSGADTARVAAERVRARGIKAGVLRIHQYRPFPISAVTSLLAGKKVVAVFDRAQSVGAAGAPVFSDVRTAMYDQPGRPEIVSYVYGLGGRDLTVDMVASIFEHLASPSFSASGQPTQTYLGARE